MLDFLEFDVSVPKQGLVVLKPDFRMDIDSEDLMIRGGDFYAIWDESSGYWSKSEKIATRLIDRELAAKAAELREKYPDSLVRVHYMRSASSGSIDRWHKYVQKQSRDLFKPLDKKIIFANTKVKKKDYVSQEKILDYPLEEGPIEAYDELMGTLYEPAERQKLEWAIGAIVCGDSKKIQKFEVLYGAAGTGKSTVLNIIDDLFGDYVSVFNAKELASVSNAFSLESFASDPLVTIQHDGDLSRIEDNTKLNSVVSHETLPVNTKYGKIYNARFETFIFMGTNNPVKITDAKSGLLRRLIDVNPSGRKVPSHRYDELLSQIKFEKGAIAWHCLQVYKELGRHYYDTYVPTKMMGATNDFYNFVEYNYDLFKREDKTTAKNAWALYDEYCEYANARKISYTPFKMELSNYFKEFYERKTIDGHDYRCLYSGFRTEKFENGEPTRKQEENDESWLDMKEQPSLLDIVGKDWPAQYCKTDGSPAKAWSRVDTTLKNLTDTHVLHWLKPPEDANLIVIDFDIPDVHGKKSFKLNYEEARKWPKTYAELSKSGEGIHLHYYYTGDVKLLSRIFDEHIEIKIFTGGSSLRRQLSKCNNVPIATISSGLPLKGEANKVVNWEGIKNDQTLRYMIIQNLHKKYHPDTTSSVDYIKHLLDQAYESGIDYVIEEDMQKRIRNFAKNSTNQSDRCLKTVDQMKFMSKNREEGKVETVPAPEVRQERTDSKEKRLVFFDCEVYPNFFCIVWKYAGSDTCVHMVNPTPEEVEMLFHYDLVGFNCRQYDNHILFAASLGWSNEELYELSQKIINRERGCFFSRAYDISYTDVYDFCTEKMSLKKWEIRLDISHQEMGIPWDQPVPEDRMEEVVGYCENDVRATEAVFNARQGDFMARKIQVALVGLLHGEEVAA